MDMQQTCASALGSLKALVCPLIDHGKQPLKIYTEVVLLYLILFIIYYYYYYCNSHRFIDIQALMSMSDWIEHLSTRFFFFTIALSSFFSERTFGVW